MQNWRRWAMAITGVLAMLLAGCGSPSSDGEGNPLPAPTTTRSLSLELALLASDGSAATRIEAGSTRRVEVAASVRTVVRNGERITSDSTAPAGNLIVELRSDGATFEPANGRVVTDAQGRASAVLVAGSATGAQTLTASASLSETGAASGSLNYEIVRGSQPRLSLRLLDSSQRDSNTLRAGEAATALALVEDVQLGADGSVLARQPRSGVVVVFGSDAGVFDPANGSALSNAQGEARVRFQAGTTSGAYTLSAAAQTGGSAATSASLALQVNAPRLQLGSGNPFTAGRLAASGSALRQGESLLVSGQLRDEDGRVFDLPVDVRFSSLCADLGSASLPASVRALAGEVSASYSPLAGCRGQDRIRAEALLPGQTLGAVAELAVNVLPALPGGISFVDASATQLALRGRASGSRPERADLRFRVTDDRGLPVPGVSMRFSLSNEAGGLSLLQGSATSDADGIGRVSVQSGTRALSFRVLAEISSPPVLAQSDVLTVSSGTPDQDSLSLSVETFNIEGFDVDGTATTLTLRAADFFNNPVADGSLATVTSEGGAVDPVCRIEGGVCSVRLVAQNPRPADGRVGVLLTLPGDESFTDLNGNGQYDRGEPFEDLGEAFRDDNEDNRHQTGEPFIDRNRNGVRDGGNGAYDGILCGGDGCTAGSAIDARAEAVVVFATSAADIDIAPGALLLDELSPQPLAVRISDRNGNLPAAGTTVAVSTSNGQLLGNSSVTVGNSNARGPLRLELQLVGDGQPSSGVLNVVVTSPRGIVSQRQITVNDISICASAPVPLPPGCDGGDVSVGEITVQPTQFTVQPNDSKRPADVTIGVFAGSGSSRRPYSGVVPTVSCSPGSDADDFTISPPGSIANTDSTGQTSARFSIDAGPLPRGSWTCVVRAGDREQVVRFDAAALAVSTLQLIPNTFAVTPNQVATTLTTQVGVFASSNGNLLPVAGVRPVIGACSTAGSSDFFILPPAEIAPTNAQGGTQLAFVLNSGAAPTGTWSCPVSAGGITTTISFTAP